MLEKNHLFLSLFFLLQISSLYSQTSLNGIVTNQKEEPLPFVNILINDSPIEGVISDIDGKFEINIDDKLTSLTMSYVGYEMKRISLQDIDNQEFLNIQMKSIFYEFDEIVVRAGENPAHRIIRKVIENRDRYDPKKLDGYSCTIYNKTVLDFLPNADSIEQMAEKVDTSKYIQNKQYENLQKMNKSAEKMHLMVMEAVTKRDFKPIENYSDSIILNRVSGFQNPKFAAVITQIQPFSFYEEVLSIMEKDFINPISKGTFKRYFFNIEDTLFQQKDTVFIIAFHPLKKSNVEGLKGVLYINTNGFAIQNVIAEPPDTKFITLKIEQQYQKAGDGLWFPEQLNFELEAPKYPHKNMGMRISGKSYISNVKLNPKFDSKTFKNNEANVLALNANRRADTLWQPYRLNDLSEKELNTYAILDSVGRVQKFDQKMDIVESLYSGHYPIGKFDVLIHKVLAINDYEGARLGVGLATNDTLSRFFSIGGYGGFGFKDQAWKYGGFLKLKLLKDDQLNWNFEYKKEIFEPGFLDFPLQSGFLSHRFYANIMDEVKEYSTTLEGKLTKFGQWQANFNYQELTPQYEYLYEKADDELIADFDFPEFKLNFRYAFGERFSNFMGAKVTYPTAYPIFQLGFTKGLNINGLGGFDYEKYTASIRYDFIRKSLGETTIRIEGGLAKGDLPFPKLFSSSGVGRNFQLFILDNTFQTMDLYEFLSDRFVHFFFKHDFGARLFKTEKFKPEISIVHNLAFGTLTNEQVHQYIDYKTLKKGFFEGGLILSKLLNFNYVNLLELGLGAGVYYRYGPYSNGNWKDNTAFRLDISFDF
jgi:hypothetical protein